ncbi:M14 family zinc carboxypeptidase [Alicyclobacillus dauci]|uniref:M14 family zinc carboxypeptidase n=1 Tax=Alicyclobacillus dauci TaxID=1475485 RepID=A0ABY6Z355_9BACL|nr:M14 family zinc carboxypeptidase [Alicyclobacillus dauci]WAH36719.1 M14 family zinc carboxypeptidase [Alicyclobacillus dauci]
MNTAKFLGIAAAMSLLGVSMPAVAHASDSSTASTTPAPSYQTSSISLNAKTISTPSSFVKDGTTYIPIWYVMQALSQANIQNTWNNGVWSITIPSNITWDETNLPANNANQPSITVNGKPVINMPTVAAVDPASHAMTTYVPIWYMQQVLPRIQVQTNWDGQHWSMTLDQSQFGQSPSPTVHTISPIVNPNRKYTYTDMEADIRALANRYPDLVHTKVIGQTAYGRNIDAVSIGTGSATALVTGSFHAREWITTNLVMYMMDQYAQAYERNSTIDGNHVKAILDKTTMWFVPMVNPDGVTLEQSGLSAFPSSAWAGLKRMNGGSSNFTSWKANAEGIDLNRQFGAGWSGIYFDPVTHPWYEDYKGPKPYDTAEVKSLLGLIQAINPQMLITYHASGGLIYWQYKVTGTQLLVDQNYAKQLSGITGYPLVPISPNPSAGGLNDWWTNYMQRPGYTIEVGPPCGANPVPVSYFNSIWNRDKVDGLFIAIRSASLYPSHQSIQLKY